MSKLTLVLCLSFAALGAYAAGPLRPAWTSISDGLIGVVPGVTQLLIDSTGTTLYSLTPSGVFKSPDSGSSWTAVGNIAGVNATALDPASASTFYAGTAHGVVKTGDGGRTWNQAGLFNIAVTVLAIDPQTPSTLYANGNGDSIYKSVDGGGTWTSASVGIPSAASIAFVTVDPLTPSTLYVMTGGPSGSLYKSTDKGQSWALVNPGPFYATVLVADPSANSTLHAILGRVGLCKSTDGGTTWSATGLASPAVALGIDPSNSNTLYASLASETSQVVMESTDGGENWSVVDTIPAIVPTPFPVTRTLVVNPSVSIYVTTGAGIFKSADAGITWAESDAGLCVHDIRMLTTDPLNPAILYAGDNNGLFQSVDGGVKWNQLSTFQVLPPPPGSTPFPTFAVPR